MAYIVMVCTVMACIVMAYVVMAAGWVPMKRSSGKKSAEQSPAGLVLCDQQRSRLPHQLAEPAGRTHTCVQNELKRHSLLETLGLDHVELEGRCAVLEEDEYQQACVLDHTKQGGLLQNIGVLAGTPTTANRSKRTAHGNTLPCGHIVPPYPL